ncbi:MAG: hypothetical protein IT236_17045, partial [Bacteroidia bacterium]|nr:hypothetical protein [Bacteroidia bacterium]
LAQHGLPFESEEAAKRHFAIIQQQDSVKLQKFISDNKAIQLDYTLNSLLRLEDFYLKCFVEKTETSSYTKNEFEYLITVYVRQQFVNNKLASWTVVENEFAKGRYEKGLDFGNYGKQVTNYGLALDKASNLKTRNYLLEMYKIFDEHHRLN